MKMRKKKKTKKKKKRTTKATDIEYYSLSTTKRQKTDQPQNEYIAIKSVLGESYFLSAKRIHNKKKKDPVSNNNTDCV
jgi:hypothetical protein